MADIKKFLDSQGTTYLWSKIAAELNKKADGSDLTALTTRVGTAESDIDALQALHAANGQRPYRGSAVRGLGRGDRGDLRERGILHDRRRGARRRAK